MTIKSYLVAGLVVVAIAAGYGWWHNQIKAAEARGRIEELVTQLEQRTAEFRAFNQAATERDNQSRLAIAQMDEAQEELLAELAVAQRESRTAKQRLAQHLTNVPDSTVAVVNETVAALEAENTACSLALTNCTEASAERDTRIVGLLDAQAARDSLIREQEVAIERLQELQHPSSSLPWIVAGAAVALGLAAIVFQ